MSAVLQTVAARVPVADGRPVPVLRAPPRPLPGGQRRARPGGVAGRPPRSARTSRASTAGGCTTARSCPGSPPTRTAASRRSPTCGTGLIDHSDSLGAAARFGRGDVQWMTAGAGRRAQRDVPAARPRRPQHGRAVPDLAQPARPPTRWSTPHFSMLWDARHPAAHVDTDDDGRTRRGDRDRRPPRRRSSRRHRRPRRGRRGPNPTWRSGTSCSSRARRGRCRRPARPTPTRTLYVFEGGELDVDGEPIAASTGVVVDAARDVPLRAAERTEILMLQARPLDEPVAQYGPFVMNTRAEIQQAFADYQRTQFGGWPWDRDDPVHGIDHDRFARHADGRVEHGRRPPSGQSLRRVSSCGGRCCRSPGRRRPAASSRRSAGTSANSACNERPSMCSTSTSVLAVTVELRWRACQHRHLAGEARRGRCRRCARRRG